MNEIEDSDLRLLKRFTIIQNLEYYIAESVYYRSNREDMSPDSKKKLWNFGEDSGKIKLYENSN
jgi:hypothetical protein